MREYFDLYLRCFPDYPTTLELFENLLRPDLAHRVIRRESGRLVGYGLVHGASIAMLCVDESYRRQGIGSTLLKECEDYICGLGGEKATLGCGEHYLFQGVPVEDGVIHFFEKRGYSAPWVSINMEMPLAGFSPETLNIPPAPQDVVFRMAGQTDTAALLETVRNAQENWTSIFETCKDPILVAEQGGRIVGFEVLSTDGAYFLRPGQKIGSIGCVGVIPDQREHGIGLQMVAAGAQWLKEQGCTHIELRFTWLQDWYGRLGFHTVSRQWMGEKLLNE